MTGYIYVVAAPEAGVVKFGYSTDPDRRLAQLGQSSPVPLRLDGSISAPPHIEGLLHYALRSARSHGEWFKSDDTNVAAARALICDDRTTDAELLEYALALMSAEAAA